MCSSFFRKRLRDTGGHASEATHRAQLGAYHFTLKAPQLMSVKIRGMVMNLPVLSTMLILLNFRPLTVSGLPYDRFSPN